VIQWGIKGKRTTVVAIGYDQDDNIAFFDFPVLYLLVNDGTYCLKYELTSAVASRLRLYKLDSATGSTREGRVHHR
jgi:hypothetical protein